MIKYTDQRVGIFVDAQNMYHSARNLFRARLNFKELLKAGQEDRRLIHAIAYVVRSEASEEEGFFDALTKSGFAVKVKDLQIFAGGMKKADWDVGLAVDAIRFAEKLDVIVLVSGDGDFIPLVRYLKENKGCQVEVIAFGKTTSTRLVEEVDDFIDLSEDPKRFLLHQGKIKQ